MIDSGSQPTRQAQTGTSTPSTSSSMGILESAATTPISEPVSGSEQIDHKLELPASIASVDKQPERTTPRPLPQVWCTARACIPMTREIISDSMSSDQKYFFLHTYRTSVDAKEHKVLVFGARIRSKTVDRIERGETEFDRIKRGAYFGRLYPGYTASRLRNRPELDMLASPDLSLSTFPSDDQFSSAPTATGLTECPSPPLVRIHSECYTGETVWSARCDCGEQLGEAARLMAESSADAGPGGVIVYLAQEGRGIGLAEKLKAYNLQDLGFDTYEANVMLNHPADGRSYAIATAILLDLGLGGPVGIKLLTNNPDKVESVTGPENQIKVVERVPMVPLAWQSGRSDGIESVELEKYLHTKIQKFHHMI